MKMSTGRFWAKWYKAFLALTLAVFVLATVPVHAYAYNAGTYVTCYESMNTRSGPGLNYAKKGILKKGTTVTIVQVSGNWGKMQDGRWIRLDGGYAAWKGSSSAASPSTYRTGVYSVRYNGTNLRTGPGLNYGVATRVNAGTRLSVTGVSGEWGKAVYGNRTVWIRLNGYATYASALPAVSSISRQASAMVDKAASHVGYKNADYRRTGTPFGVWYASKVRNSGFKKADWCAMFVCYVANEAGVSTNQIPLFASCGDGINKLKSMGCWKARGSYTPQAGDLIFYQWTSGGRVYRHVGIVEKTANGNVYTIEGNTGSGEVKRHCYSLNYSRILGYGTPKYR